MAAFPNFWSTLSSDADEEYAELVADVSGFEDAIRGGIARAITLSMRSIKIDTALGLLNFPNKEALAQWSVSKLPGWSFVGDALVQKTEEEDSIAPSAAGTASSGKVKFEQMSRVIKRVYENQLIH